LGIVTVHTPGYNQADLTVIEFRRSVIVYRRGHAPRTTPDLSSAPA